MNDAAFRRFFFQSDTQGHDAVGQKRQSLGIVEVSGVRDGDGDLARGPRQGDFGQCSDLAVVDLDDGPFGGTFDDKTRPPGEDRQDQLGEFFFKGSDAVVAFSFESAGRLFLFDAGAADADQKSRAKDSYAKEDDL